MTLREKVYDTLRNKIKSAFFVSFHEAAAPDFLVEVPRDSSHGDYSTNIALLLAKDLKRPPREIAARIAQNIGCDDLVQKVAVAGAGFINFYLNRTYIYNTLLDIEEQGKNYGRIQAGGGKRIIVEFVSANPTGPMHMGNARGGAIGDCLSSLLDMAGYDVWREFYVNDAGAQIEKFGRSLEARYIELLTGSVEFPEDGYQGEDITCHAREYIRLYGDSLLSADAPERRKRLVDYALPLNLSAIRRNMELYRINYDAWFHESSLYQSGEVEEVISILRQSGLTYEKDGALWFKSAEFGSEKDDVLVRANGVPTYFAADIAYHRNKLVTRGFDMAINIWGADHHGHISRMKGAMQALGIDPGRLHVITMQLVRLMENGGNRKNEQKNGQNDYPFRIARRDRR